MELDFEYSLAVNNLCLHKCTLADVALFNSQTIKTMFNPHGVDMSGSENIEATVIVSTNSLHTTINFHKSYAVCNVKNGPDIVICAALDSVNNEETGRWECHMCPDSRKKKRWLSEQMGMLYALQ